MYRKGSVADNRVYTQKRRSTKSKFRVDWLCPRQEKHTMWASQKSKSEIPSKEDGKGYFDLRAFARC
jgi:hypothetical protein